MSSPEPVKNSPINLFGFDDIKDNYTKKIITIDTPKGKKSFTLHITFKVDSLDAEREAELKKYADLASSIAAFAYEMQLGVPNEEKHRKLTRLEFGKFESGLPQIRRVYESTDPALPCKPTTPISIIDYFSKPERKAKASGIQLFSALYPDIRGKLASKKSAPIASASIEKNEEHEEDEAKIAEEAKKVAKKILANKAKANKAAEGIHLATKGKERLKCNLPQNNPSVKKLKKQFINPFFLAFNNFSDQKKQNEDYHRQAKEIFNYCKAFLQERPKDRIAITYSANTKQANEIYAGYEGNDFNIDGANQAQVFNLLVAMIKKDNLQGKIHILPVPTCTTSGGQEIASMQDVQTAINNIRNHLKHGWVVLGLHNQSSTAEHPYAIGGGVAARVWNGSEQQEYVEHEMASMTKQRL